MKRLLFCAALVMGFSALHAQERSQQEIHAAMIYNFIKYVQWPNEAEPGDFVIGILGDEELFTLLKTRYDGKPAKGGKKYAIRKLASAAESADCHVVYLSKTKNREFDGIKSSTAGKAVLTITDSSGLGQKGSCFNLRVIDGKLRFELNQAVVNGANLKVSSQLASMAVII